MAHIKRPDSINGRAFPCSGYMKALHRRAGTDRDYYYYYCYCYYCYYYCCYYYSDIPEVKRATGICPYMSSQPWHFAARLQSILYSRSVYLRFGLSWRHDVIQHAGHLSSGVNTFDARNEADHPSTKHQMIIVCLLQDPG